MSDPIGEDDKRMCAPMTIRAAPNIALIKYWGKSDDNLNIPFNSSLSITLHRDDLFTETVVSCTGSNRSSLKINGKDVTPIPERVRRMMRACAEYEGVGLAMESVNNFPSACGLASSSSGMAALAFGIAWFSGCGKNGQNDEDQIGLLARLGSGSACRSIYGGFVEWSSDQPSLPRQIQPHTHWPDLRIIVLIFDDGKKLISSTEGMKRSMETSRFLKQRLQDFSVENSVLTKMKNAIKEKDFNEFSKLTMIESNKLHAICMDTYPPLLYLNDASRAFITFVHQINDNCRERNEDNKFAYSFDAGPNAFCFAEKPKAIIGLIRLILNFASAQKLSNVKRIEAALQECCLEYGFKKDDNRIEKNQLIDGLSNERTLVVNDCVFNFVKQLKDIIVTKPGPAPLVSLGQP